MDYSIIITVVSFLAGLATFVGSLVWWLAGQFKTLGDLIFKVKDDILSKLEYHEKHDDQRFLECKTDLQMFKNDIWELRLRNATQDGVNNVSTIKQNRKESKSNHDSN